MADGLENRAHGRRRTIFGGVAYAQDGGTWECAIVDISESGAKLRVKTDLKIGDKVDLKINKFNELRSCEVIWVREGEVGLRFIMSIDPRRTGMDNLLGIFRK